MARNPLWAWSLRLYRQQGVAPACIALQDRAGIDVNLLLFCLWAGREGRALQGRSLKQALTVTRDWVEIIGPLREARRTLKPIAAADAKRLRAAVLQVELQAERLVQDRLHALPLPRTESKGVTLAADNAGRYFRQGGIRLVPRDWAALKTIVRAAF